VAPEKLYALQKLEETGGKPQLIGIDRDEFIFEDRSKESPSGRRNQNFDQAAEMAKKFGVDMMSREAYIAMQKTGKFDLNTWSWLATPASTEVRESGNALRGNRYDDGTYVERNPACNLSPFIGWRASLRVKKV
jgi:hypothetical protein